jgi:heme-binding NEAT domain protein
MRQTINAKTDMQAIFNGSNYQILADADFEFERTAQEANNTVREIAQEVIDCTAGMIWNYLN